MGNEILHPATEEVEAYVAGALSDADRAALESHLVGCASCTAEVEEWRSLFLLLSDLPQIEPRAGFADRVMARVRVRQPWPVRIAAVVRRLIPDSIGGWSLLIALLSLPVLTIGGLLTWLVSRPWLSLEALWVFITLRTEALLLAIASGAADVMIESAMTSRIVSSTQGLLSSIGRSGIGAGFAIIAVLISISTWTLYQNLFRNSMRGGSDATT